MKLHYILYPLVVLIGGVFGAAVMLRTMDSIEQKRPLDLKVGMRAEVPWVVTTRAGWGSVTLRGVPIIASRAELDLPLPYAARQAVLFDIVTDEQSSIANQRAALRLEVNGQIIGSATRLGTDISYRFLIPAQILNSQIPAQIAVMTDRADGSLLVREFAIKETSLLSRFAGTVDACKGTTLSGWAAAENGPAPITVTRNGAVIAEFLSSLPRPDVEKTGRPLNSGFAFEFDRPIAAGDRIEVRYPNGAQLPGPPCSP